MEKGGAAFGVFVAIPSPAIIEMCGHAGFDFAIIDTEHGAISADCLENMIRAAEASGISPFVRVRNCLPESILMALDRGAMGIVVPHLTSPEQALAASQACRYYPLGNRGMSAAGRAAGFGKMPPDEYFAKANREVIFMPMIEDIAGIENIDAILAVKGIDMILVGSGDLSQACGVPGQPMHPKVQELVGNVYSAAQKAKVAFCAIAKDRAMIEMWKSKGVNCFIAGDDQRIIFGALSTLFQSVSS